MSVEHRPLTQVARDRLVHLLEHAQFELIPLRGALDLARDLPAGAEVAVTASPTKGMDATMDLAAGLAAAGFDAIPHIAARGLVDRAELATVLDRAREADITRALVVGGDQKHHGEFPDGLSLLRAMADLGHPFDRVGIPGYPEGHPFIPDAALNFALDHKAEFASSVTTQMCFDDDAIRSWIAATRRRGLALPVHLGISGVAPLLRLAAVAARIGVGDSARFLSSHTKLLGRLVRPGGYAPDELLLAMGDLYADEAAAVAGLHIYTFNQVETTEEWRREFVDSLT